MGLDMHLVTVTEGEFPHYEDIEGYNYIEEVYWRKANAIHKYFVDLAGVDNCEPFLVTKEILENLQDICQKILADRQLAEDLLPSQSGFFFGNTSYDDYYYDQLEYTVERIENLFGNKVFEGNDVYYWASW